jgi:flagella basal body P-ring formation protein FlgA
MLSAVSAFALLLLPYPEETPLARRPVAEDATLRALSQALSSHAKRTVTVEPVDDFSVASFRREKIEASQIMRPARPSALSVLRYCASAVGEEGAQPERQCLRFRASYRAKVARARVHLSAGKGIGLSDIETEEGQFSPFEVPPPEPEEVLLGMRASRHIRAGSIIRSPDLSAAPSLHKGEPVCVRFRKKEIVIRFTARATSDAKSGSITFLEGPFGGKRLRAVTGGRGEAELRLNSMVSEEE